MERLRPRRRPPAGGYARGDEKQVRIIEAALRRFGEDGYERASTRQIAQDAGVNTPALQYYFDSKRGLHLACVEYLAQRFNRAMQDAYGRSQGVRDPDAALDALCDIMDAMADYLFETVEADGWSRFMARCQGEEGDDPGYELLRKAVAEELHSHCSRLLGLIIGRPAADSHTRLRAAAILGQLTVFHLGRSITLAQLGWPDLRGPRLRMLKDVLRAQTRAALQAPAPPDGHHGDISDC